MTVRWSGGRRQLPVLLGALVVAGVAVAALGCGGSAEATGCGRVEFRGTGNPGLVLVSDLPLQGASAQESSEINEAIRAQFQERGFRAGAHTIGFQACDDSTAAAGRSDPGRCASNANTYTDDESKVIGVIGPLDSLCATILIPALNQAPNGGIPIISPANTYPCLTRGGAGCDVTEPGKYYPSDRRNYLRVAPNDVFQGAANAEFAHGSGVKRVFVLHDKEAYGVGMASSFRAAARSVGIDVVGFEGWNPAAPSYTALFERVRSSHADAVFLGGLVDQHGGQVIKDKVAVLGRNVGPVRLLASDGFATQQTIDDAGAAALGMTISAVGLPQRELSGKAKHFTEMFAAGAGRGTRPNPKVIYGAQAAQIMLDAIAKSNGTRSDVTAKLFESKVADGLLGTFGFDANGDPTDATGPVVGFTILAVGRALKVETTVVPEGAIVRAAAGGG